MANLPEEMVIEDILTRLPVRPLLRFKCVSRSWHSIISDPAFANSHIQMSLSSGTKNRVLISSNHLRSIDYNQRDNPIITGLHSCRWYVRTLGSHNGLVCLSLTDSDTVILYNPSTRYYRRIKLPSSRYNIGCCGFGFDSRSQEYKVVSQLRLDPHRYVLFSLTNQVTTHREIRCDIDFLKWNFGTFVNGSIHWLFSRVDNWSILRLDLAQELFDELPTPRVIQNVPTLYHSLSILRGCLSLVSRGAVSSAIWVMMEYGVNTSWSTIMVIPHQAINSQYFMPLSFRSETEILLRINRHRLVIFNSENQEGLLENVFTDWLIAGFDTSVYMESIVSPFRV